MEKDHKLEGKCYFDQWHNYCSKKFSVFELFKASWNESTTQGCVQAGAHLSKKKSFPLHEEMIFKKKEVIQE